MPSSAKRSSLIGYGCVTVVSFLLSTRSFRPATQRRKKETRYSYGTATVRYARSTTRSLMESKTSATTHRRIDRCRQPGSHMTANPALAALDQKLADMYACVRICICGLMCPYLRMSTVGSSATCSRSEFACEPTPNCRCRGAVVSTKKPSHTACT